MINVCMCVLWSCHFGPWSRALMFLCRTAALPLSHRGEGLWEASEVKGTTVPAGNIFSNHLNQLVLDSHVLFEEELDPNPLKCLASPPWLSENVHSIPVSVWRVSFPACLRQKTNQRNHWDTCSSPVWAGPWVDFLHHQLKVRTKC